jgi:hypothetical protein
VLLARTGLLIQGSLQSSFVVPSSQGPNGFGGQANYDRHFGGSQPVAQVADGESTYYHPNLLYARNQQLIQGDLVGWGNSETASTARHTPMICPPAHKDQHYYEPLYAVRILVLPFSE